MSKANDITNKSWVDVSADPDFSIQNIPFGIGLVKGNNKVVSAIGSKIVDVAALNADGYLKGLEISQVVLENEFLNDFISLGKSKTNAVRERIANLLNGNNTELQGNENAIKNVLIEKGEVKMQMPLRVGNYTDFYSSIEHATNVGTMFRDPANALLPNWKHIPIGYHGRASSIVVSGTDFHRPKGQTKAPTEEVPKFGPTQQLDFELEMGFVVGKETKLGESVSTTQADEYIFGMLLFNDWSARDIQNWEYVPLGPFLAKNFASSVSPWVVTLEALEPFRTEGYIQEPAVLPYLKYEGNKNIDIQLQVFIQPEKQEENLVAASNYKYMYWNMNQQLAHHTVNGCNIKVGDIYASGTISGKSPDSFGSMLELTWRGSKPLKLADGSERKFINDNDTVIMRGYCEKDGIRVGFGEVKGKVLPAN
jgi:fumarylacetoacetase